MARRLGAVDMPDERRVHRIPIPRLGGLAMFFGIIVPSLAFLDLSRPVRGLLLGATVATAVGAIDDFRGLRWWEKLGGQIVAATIPVIFGIWIDHFTFPFLGVYDLPAWLGGPLTVHLDRRRDEHGQLPRRPRRARRRRLRDRRRCTFTVIELSLGKPTAAVFTAIVFGATLGFLRHNFFPARIFMGDSGAMLLGFSLAAVSVEGLLKTAATVALFFPLLVLAVPILDTGFVVARRLKYRHADHRAGQGAPPPPLRQPRLLAAACRLYIYFWVATLAAAALGHALHPVPRGRPVAHVADGRSGRARPARGRRVRLHGLPARDRQAREPARSGAAGARGRGRAPQRLGTSFPAFPHCQATFACHKLA